MATIASQTGTVMNRLYIALGLLVALANGSTALSAPRPMVKSFDIVQTNFLGSLWNEAHARASVVSQRILHRRRPEILGPPGVGLAAG